MRKWIALFLVVCLTLVVLPVLAASSGADAGHHAELNWFDFSHWIGDNPNPTPPLIALFLNFGLLLWVVYLILRGPMGRKFKGRRADLENELEEANRLKEEAQKALADIEVKMETVDDEMAKLKEQILDLGKLETEHILKESEERASRIQSDAQAVIEHEVLLRVAAIKKQIATEVIATAEKLIREKMSAADNARLMDEYIESINAESLQDSNS